MTITYINHVETVTDSLRYLLVTEFNNDIEQSKIFEPDKLGRGEYFRYYLSEQPVLAKFSDGEERNYIFNCVWYFNTKKLDYKKTFDSLVSERIERLKRLLANYSSYSPSDVYKWHNIIVESEESFYLGEEDEEALKYSHILCVPIIITITRSDINQ